MCPAESWSCYYRSVEAVQTPFFVGNNTLLTSEDTLVSDEDGQWQLTWRVSLISDSGPGLTSLRDSLPGESVWYTTPGRTYESSWQLTWRVCLISDSGPGLTSLRDSSVWYPTPDRDWRVSLTALSDIRLRTGLMSLQGIEEWVRIQNKKDMRSPGMDFFWQELSMIYRIPTLQFNTTIYFITQLSLFFNLCHIYNEIIARFMNIINKMFIVLLHVTFLWQILTQMQGILQGDINDSTVWHCRDGIHFT